MAQTPVQLDAFKKSSTLFSSKYYKDNVWDVQRDPPNATAGTPWRLSGFAAPYDAKTGGFIDWGTTKNRYLSFDLVISATGSYTDDVMNSGNKFNIVLKLYEANGTYVKDICRLGTFMGFGNKGFLFNQDNFYGTFFANDSYTAGGEVTYTPVTGKLTKLSELKDYKYSPQLLTKPAVTTTTFTYNGTPQGLSIPANAAYTVSGASATNVDNYTATITLNDKVKYTWSDGTTDDVTIAWSIIKGTYNMTTAKWDYTAPFTYDGNPKSVTLTGLPIGVTVQSYTGNSATTPGSYSASATLAYDAANYNAPAPIASLNWEIINTTVIKPTVATTAFTYNGTPQGLSIPENAAYTVYGASATDVNNYTATITLKDKVKYTWADGTTDDVTIAWSIIKGTYNMTTAKWDYTAPFTYDGNPKSVTLTGLPSGVTVQSYYGNSFTNAGKYLAQAGLSYDKTNYNAPTPIAALKWQIDRASINKPTVATTTFTYNGTSQGLTIPENVTYTVSGAASATDAGRYTATVALKDKANYQWSDGTTDDVNISWSIAKASFDMSNAKWDYTAPFTYNGTSKSVTLTGLPVGVTVQNYTGNSATNAGTYTASATLTYDAANYNDPTPIAPLTWEISKAMVNMPTVTTTAFTYNSNPQGISIPENTAYTISGVASATNAGSYTATVALNNKANYQWNDGTTGDINISWSISAIGVAKPTVTTTSFTYNSNPQGISIPENTAYTISGVASATNAGSYTATVALKDKANYQWNDGTTGDISINWNIAKASYDMSSTKWNYTTPIPFDGTQKTVAVTGLPSGVTVKSYLGNTATTVGIYTASATFAYDEVNYNEPTIASLSWEIEKTFTNLSIIKLWNNVLAVSNGDKYEEIRNATFRWYRNGTLLSGSQQYLRFDGAIPAGEYKVEITTKDGFTITVTYTVAAAAAVKAYPNPLMAGTTLTIETGEERSANEQVQVYNLLGTPVRAAVNRETNGYRISGLNASGTYLIRIAKPGETPTSIKVIVK